MRRSPCHRSSKLPAWNGRWGEAESDGGGGIPKEFVHSQLIVKPLRRLSGAQTPSPGMKDSARRTRGAEEQHALRRERKSLAEKGTSRVDWWGTAEWVEAE